MTLDQLKEICGRTGLNFSEQNEIVEHLNKQRFSFEVKELPEIKPPAPLPWLSRSIKSLSEAKLAEINWEYYLSEIKKWIILLENHELTLTAFEKVKRSAGKYKWMLGLIPIITSLVTCGDKLGGWLVALM